MFDDLRGKTKIEAEVGSSSVRAKLLDIYQGEMIRIRVDEGPYHLPPQSVIEPYEFTTEKQKVIEELIGEKVEDLVNDHVRFPFLAMERRIAADGWNT